MIESRCKTELKCFMLTFFVYINMFSSFIKSVCPASAFLEFNTLDFCKQVVKIMKAKHLIVIKTFSVFQRNSQNLD